MLVALINRSVKAGLTAKGNTLFFNNQGVFLVGLFLSSLLAFIQFAYSSSTNSLLLFTLGILQTGVSISFLTKLISALIISRIDGLRFNFLFSLVSGFILSLSTGFTFIETYSRISHPVDIQSWQAVLASATVLGGNLLLVKLMLKIGWIDLNTGSMKLSFSKLAGLSSLLFLSLLTIHFTDLYVLDTILAFLLGMPLLVLAAFITIDAYWKLIELL